MTPSNASPVGSQSGGQIGGLIRLMRPKQWVKNAFVLAPLIFARAFHDTTAVIEALLAVALFCAASSASYIINDLHDREADRAHPTKRHSRPLASGRVTTGPALVLLVVLYALLISTWFWSRPLAIALLAYVALNLAYTFWLKHQPVLDIFSIAVGFVLRVYGGAAVLQVPLSSWMAITTLCLALYLAAVKRRQEFAHVGSESRKVLENYTPALIDRYAEMSAVGALIFYSLFVMSASPGLVWTIPLVIFGMFRYWYVVEKLEGGESPTDVVLTDIPLALTIGVWAGLCVVSLRG